MMLSIINTDKKWSYNICVDNNIINIMHGIIYIDK